VSSPPHAVVRYRDPKLVAERNLRGAKLGFFVTRSKSSVHYCQYIHFSNGTT